MQCLKCDETLQCLVFDINFKKQLKTDLLLLLITFKLSEFHRLDRFCRPLVSSSFWFESCIWHILYTSFDSSSAGLICRMMSSISISKKKKDYSIFRYVAYFIQNEFGNRGAGEEKNPEFLGKNSLGERGGGRWRS